MTLKIFADLMSQPSRALPLFCRAAKIPHELKELRIQKGEFKSPEISKINPLQTSPCAEHNGVALKESMAIIRYIANVFPIEDHWYPKEPLAQQRVDEYLHWQHMNTRLNCAMYFQHRWLIPMVTQQPPKESSVARFQQGMEKNLEQIENVWLENGNKKYLCGDKISVADIVALCELEQPSIAGYDVKEGRPILADWMNRVQTDLQPHYDDIHKALYKMREKFGIKPESKL